MNRTAPLLALCLLLPQSACAGRKQPDPIVVEDALAFATTDRAKAAQLLEDAILNEPARADEMPLLMVHAGEQRRLMGERESARAWFERALSARNPGRATASAELGLALLDAGAEPSSAALDRLASLPERDALGSQNADRHLVLAIAASRSNDTSASRDHARRALAYAKADPQVQARVQEALDALSRGEPLQVADATPEPDGAPIERARAAWADGDLQRAERLAQRILDDSPDGPDARAAAYLLEMIEVGTRVDPNRIGLLLPLSDKYAGVGAQMRQAFTLGYDLAPRELVVVDSGSTPETAVQALEDLVIDQGVVAVVGPLLTDETAPVVEAAHALGVPLVSLSQAAADVDASDWTFQAVLTPQAQAQALAAFSIEQQGMRRFGIFAPDSNYGRTSAEFFTQAVEERGGEITITTFYDPEATDLIPFASEFGRKDYDTRREELRELKRIAEERGGNPDSVVLPPVIDFDAIFIPDNHARVALATAALAYEEFPMGGFQLSDDGPVVPLLGLSGWNNPALVQSGGQYTQGSFFTDAWLPGDPAVLPFTERYRAELGRSPGALEAMIADAGRLVAVASRTDADTRAAFRDALAQAAISDGSTGLTGFDDETGAAERSVRILTMTRDAIEQVFPPPAVPAVPTDGVE